MGATAVTVWNFALGFDFYGFRFGNVHIALNELYLEAKYSSRVSYVFGICSHQQPALN